MRTKPGLILRSIGPDNIIVDALPHGHENSSMVYTLNATAAALWSYAVDFDDFTPADLAARLVEDFEVDPDTARTDTENILNKWIAEGIVIP